MKEEKIKEASFEETTESQEEQKDSVGATDHDKQKIKNLISLCILLGGLFLGSLFVDLSQLIEGGGISKKVIENREIFNLNGKTWVAYSDPIVDVDVITGSCEGCDADEIVLQLKQLIPTMVASELESDTPEVAAMIDELGVKTIPAFVFSKEIEETEFFVQASPLFTEVDGKYVLNTAAAGIPAGKFIELPSVDEGDIRIGSEDAPITLIEFSDFQCPYCKAFHSTVGRILDEYEGKVQLVFKQLPLEAIHPNARGAALASECANEQGKFLEYSNKLFEDQKDWGNDQAEKKFKSYAVQLGLNAPEFNACFDEQRYSDKIDVDIAEADNFGVTGTPALFVNDQIKKGVSSFESLKEMIDEKLLESTEAEGEEMNLIEEIEGESEEAAVE